MVEDLRNRYSATCRPSTVDCFFAMIRLMKDEEPISQIDRLKAIYRDFIVEFLLLDKKKHRILETYQKELDEANEKRLHQDIHQSNV